MVSDNIDSLQVALAHLMFNVTGIVIWYPIPFMRRVPLNGARTLGSITRIWRGFPLLYLVLVFFLIPIILLGVSALYTQGIMAWTVLGVVITLLIAGGIVKTIYWCMCQDGKGKMVASLKQRQRKREAMENLPDELDSLKRKLQVLMDHTGAPEDDDEGEGDIKQQALIVEKGTDGELDDKGTDEELEKGLDGESVGPQLNCSV